MLVVVVVRLEVAIVELWHKEYIEGETLVVVAVKIKIAVME